jgi:hypothetical protein
MWNLWLSPSEKQEMSSMFIKEDITNSDSGVGEVTFAMNDKLTNVWDLGQIID